MKRSRFTQKQIALILQVLNAGLGVYEVCRKAGAFQQSYYRLRKKYGELMPSEVKHLKLLEEENRRLKSMVADLSLDNVLLKEAQKKCIGRIIG